MSGFAARMMCGVGMATAGIFSPAAAQRLQLVPFADIRQIGQASLSGGNNDNVTYTDVSTGLAAQTNTRRIVASLGYRFSYRIPEAGRGETSVLHNGEGRLQMQVIKEMLSLDAGVLATQSRVDAGGASPQFNSIDNRNLTQTYAVYVQPTTRHHFGEVDVIGSYRYGFVKNEGRDLSPTPAPQTNRFDNSRNQMGSLQIGMGIGELPFEWNLSSQYQREDASQLDQLYRSYNVALAFKVPVADAFAAVGSFGYESNEQSSRPVIRDPLTGAPVTDSKGRFATDKTQPRTISYDQSGLIADAGVVWRPSRRTRLEARVGRRYGGLSYSGLLEMQPGDRSTLNVVATDRINSFGRSITGGLANAPALLQFSGNDPQSSFQTCLFGLSGNGSCLGGALGQATGLAYRDRSITAIFSRRMRKLSINVGGGYTRRTYIDDPTQLVSLSGVVDQLFYLQGSGSLVMARDSGISFAFSANMFKNGQVGVGDVVSYSTNGSYYRLLGRGLRAEASLGLESSKQEGSPADLLGRAQLGVHYDF